MKLREMGCKNFMQDCTDKGRFLGFTEQHTMNKQGITTSNEVSRPLRSLIPTRMITGHIIIPSLPKVPRTPDTGSGRGHKRVSQV